jgi:hypothetical protein
MEEKPELLHEPAHVPTVTAETQQRDSVVGSVATRDRALIAAWAARHRAEPATGEATSSGPAAAPVVQDGGAAIRLNFPGVGRFRPITWEEWFEHFDCEGLVFVYEETADAVPPNPRYRIVKAEDWKDHIR